MTTDLLLDHLVSGGDDRLTLDAVTRLNLYGHGPGPKAQEIGMGSSTASTISTAAFQAIKTYHAQLLSMIASKGEAEVYEAELRRLRFDLLGLLGYEDPIRSGIEIVTAASGTDLHLLVALLLNGRDDHSLLTITLTGNETGSSVEKAASGRHFMSHLPSGAIASPGSEIEAGNDIENIQLAVRDAAGNLRDEDAILLDLDRLMAQARRCGRNCLLVVTDVSKTGLIAPGLDTVFRLKARYGDMLDVMIDACQFRISPSTIRAYLERGLMVAITGSKFIGGPIFSGALLCPRTLSGRFRRKRVPLGLGDYCAQADWPSGWAARADAPCRMNIGLLLRWHAALFEMRTFLSCPDDALFTVTSRFARAMTKRLREDPAFEPLPARPLDRAALTGSVNAPATFDQIQTIFPFCLVRPGGGRKGTERLSVSETRLVYQTLAGGSASQPPVRLGQPIGFGSGPDAFAVLRLCLSARLIANACDGEEALDNLIKMAMTALDSTARWSAAIPSSSRRAAA